MLAGFGVAAGITGPSAADRLNCGVAVAAATGQDGQGQDADYGEGGCQIFHGFSSIELRVVYYTPLA